MRFGPYTICVNGTVTFQWTGMHGVFQIPSILCPSNFTSEKTSTYQYLAPSSNGGQYVWHVPSKPGHYWVTSEYGVDCLNGESFAFPLFLLPLFCPPHPLTSENCSTLRNIMTIWHVGMIAEFYVVDPNQSPFLYNASRASSSYHTTFLISITILLLPILHRILFMF